MPQLLRTLTAAAEPAAEPDLPPPAPAGEARETGYGGVDEDVTFERPSS